MAEKKQERENNIAKDVAVLCVRVNNIEKIAAEAKDTAIGAFKRSQKHRCSQEGILESLKGTIAETRGTVDKMNETNTKFVEELGRWKWFRMLILPVIILVVTTGAGAFASFVYVKSDVDNAKREQAAARIELKEVKKTQIRLLEVAQKKEQIDDKSARNVEEIKDKLDEIVENFEVIKPKKRRR